MTPSAVSPPKLQEHRFFGHLLGQKGDDVLKRAREPRAPPRPRDGLQTHAAVRAPDPAQLALDRAATGAVIEVAPAIDPAVVDLQRPGLPTAATHPPPASEANRRDDPRAGERDIDDARARAGAAVA